jgi:hypothetical protein
MNQMANGLYRLLDNKKFPSIMKEISVSGFVRDYISIDLDFMDYDSETNTFK